MMRSFPRKPQAQRGVVLAVVLILLLVMTLLGLASLRGTLMEERMGASQFDRSLSFQAAEAALREGELLAASKPVVPDDDCADGICDTPDPTETPRWLATNWNTISRAATTDVGDLTATPRFIVEFMGPGFANPESCTNSGDVSLEATCSTKSSRYRITVRSQQAGRAEVILQSNFTVP